MSNRLVEVASHVATKYTQQRLRLQTIMIPVSGERRESKETRLIIAEDFRRMLQLGITSALAHGSPTIIDSDVKAGVKLFGVFSPFAQEMRKFALTGVASKEEDSLVRPPEVLAMDAMLEEALRGNDFLSRELGRQSVTVASFYDPESRVYAVFGTHGGGMDELAFGAIFTDIYDLFAPGRSRFYAPMLRANSTRASRSDAEEVVPVKTLSGREVYAENETILKQFFNDFRLAAPSFTRKHVSDFQSLAANWNTRELTDNPELSPGYMNPALWRKTSEIMYQARHGILILGEMHPEVIDLIPMEGNPHAMTEQESTYFYPLQHDINDLYSRLFRFQTDPQRAVADLQSLFTEGLTERLLDARDFFTGPYDARDAYRYFVQAKLLNDLVMPALQYLESAAREAGSDIRNIVAQGRDPENVLLAISKLQERLASLPHRDFFPKIFRLWV